MRDTSAVFRAVARSNKIKVAILIEASFSSGVVNLWNGYGNLSYGGNVYAGAGKLLDISAVQESIETRANGFSITLSGLDSSLLSIALSEPYTGRPFKAKLAFLAPDSDQEITMKVKVVSTSGGNKYFIEEGQQATIDVKYGNKYVFDLSDSSLAGGGSHPLRLSTTSDGTHGGGSQYTTGWTMTGTVGTAGAKATFVVPALGTYPSYLYYYCANHSGMGGSLLPSSSIILGQPYTIFDGFMDVMRLNDSGGNANIALNCESQLVALERPNTRRYTPEDQKIDFPNDEGLDYVAGLQDDEIIWGRG
tara:strand:- start:802 stop:1719 length:918 start_codon:yes stop_codon:yes gene_type:complete